MKRNHSISSTGAADLDAAAAASNGTKQSNSGHLAAVQQQQQQQQMEVDVGGCLSLLAEVAAQVRRGSCQGRPVQQRYNSLVFCS
jgi:hypothetical protein